MPDPILITGASSGIGAAVAKLAAERGHPVALGYRSQRDVALAFAADLRRTYGADARAFPVDVAHEAEIVTLFNEVDSWLAGRRLGGLVNSAGIGRPNGSILSFTGEALAHLWAVNVTGTIIASREAVRRFTAANTKPQGGAIVNVSSMAATIGGRPGASAYAASKAAVDTFTVGLAKEVAAQGVRVNVVRPGATRTPMIGTVGTDEKHQAVVAATIPINRIATAEEIAKPILWLLSDEASFITGARLDISGGGFVIGGFPRET